MLYMEVMNMTMTTVWKVVPSAKAVRPARWRALTVISLIASMVILTPSHALGLQVGTITGRVVDAVTGAGVSAAQVNITSLTPAVGVLAGSDGAYTLLAVPAGQHTVRVQRLGYRRVDEEVTVVSGAVAQVNFQLSADVLSLQEIIITGTAGGVERRAIGNTVDRVSVVDAMAAHPITTVEEALTAAAPGVSFVASPSEPTGGVRIRLRGSSSASLPGDPIILIDGIRMYADNRLGSRGIHASFSRLADLDPKDIESIEIIKGPAAATLYGTEAGNGVIQIITKKGQSGPVRFDVTVDAGTVWAPGLNFPDFSFMRPDGKMARINLARLEPQYNIPEDPYCCENITRYGLTQNYGISAQGGTGLVTYFASFNRSDSEGAVRGSYDQRNSLRSQFGWVAGSVRADMGLSTMWGIFNGGRNLDGSDFGGNFNTGGNVIAFSRNLLDPRRGFYSSPDATHPDVFTQEQKIGRNSLTVTLTHTPTTWLTHRLLLGREVATEEGSTLQRQDNFLAAYCCEANKLGTKSVNTSNVETASLDFSGTVRVNLTPRFTSVTSYGLQYYHRVITDAHLSGRGFATPGLTTVAAAGEVTGASEGFLENTSLGVYAQQQFGWDDRAFVTGALRADDNSAFGDEFSGALYPKLSATWVVSEESFWGVEAISQLRLRSAWGAAGRQPDLFAAQRLYRAVTGPNGVAAVAPLSYGNPDLGPERGEELEIGFDADLYEGRLSGQFTRYWRKTTDGILGSPLPSSMGFTVVVGTDDVGQSYFANVGDVSAWGTETAINWKVLVDDPLLWDLNFSFTTMENRANYLGGVGKLPISRMLDHAVGYPLGSLFEKKILSAEFVKGTSGTVKNLMCDSGVFVEGKGVAMQGGPPVPCANAPEVYFGHGEPNRLASIQSSWTLFQNWRMSMTLDYKGGHWAGHEYLALRSATYPASMMYYLKDDPIAQGYYTQTNRNGVALTRSGFAKLRDIQIGYTLPSGLVERIGSSRATVSLGVHNVATVWQAQSHVEREALMDLDQNRPDVNFGGDTRGAIQYRSVTLSLNASF
ncbi:MAG: hypothetical protein EXR93_12715 [Gemmatimonadetes bacterium]|nr:hypothetical protein [Gemmatimonadota bacterium]